MIATRTDVESIVGVDKSNDWLEIGALVFYKNAKPYGLIGTTYDGEHLYIASTVKDPSEPFTFEMVRYLFNLKKTTNIVLITDHEPSHAKVIKALRDHGFRLDIIGGVLYSTHNLKDK